MFHIYLPLPGFYYCLGLGSSLDCRQRKSLVETALHQITFAVSLNIWILRKSETSYCLALIRMPFSCQDTELLYWSEGNLSVWYSSKCRLNAKVIWDQKRMWTELWSNFSWSKPVKLNACLMFDCSSETSCSQEDTHTNPSWSHCICFSLFSPNIE